MSSNPYTPMPPFAATMTSRTISLLLWRYGGGSCVTPPSVESSGAVFLLQLGFLFDARFGRRAEEIYRHFISHRNCSTTKVLQVLPFKTHHNLCFYRFAPKNDIRIVFMISPQKHAQHVVWILQKVVTNKSNLLGKFLNITSNWNNLPRKSLFILFTLSAVG